MMDGLGTPQHVVVLGGGSEIGVAVAAAYVGRGTPRVTLAARPGDSRDAARDRLGALGAEVSVVDFDALDTAGHARTLEECAAYGDLDVAVVAFGVLGDEEEAWQDHAAAINLARVNYVAAVSVGVLLADRLRTQGHGVLVALSSVAGELIRRSNFVYGSSKAGMDGFYLGLGEALRGSGARVVVVRPGFVTSKMTAGRKPAPLSVGPDAVADAVVDAVWSGRDLVWVPGRFRWVMSTLRHLPRPVFRRLPL